MPSASGQARQRIVEMCREAGVPGEDAAGPLRALLGRADHADPPRAGRGRARARAGGGGLRAGRRLPRRADRRRHRRRRLDRLRALPPDRPRRRRRSCCWSSAARTLCSRSIASCGRSATSTTVSPVLADAGDSEKMRPLFEQYRPQVVFHAAAFKHVPLMELNPLESVRNNPLATRSLAEVARDTGVERFVLISTDKAVEPQTVMGAVEGARASGSSRRSARRRRTGQVHRRALRQRARLARAA